MSFQQQPLDVGNESLKFAPTINNPADPMSRYLPPTINYPQLQQTSPLPPQPLSQKQQNYPQPQQQPLQQQPLQPQPQQLLRQQYTNGIGPNSSNNSSRNASPAFNQPINSAYLPPTYQQQPPIKMQQQQQQPLPPLPAQSRPNAYGQQNTQQQFSAPSSQPGISNTNSTTNIVTSSSGNAAVTSGNTRSTPVNQLPPPTLPITSNQNQTSVDKVTNNLQNMNLQNYTNGTLSPVSSPLTQYSIVSSPSLTTSASIAPPRQTITTPSQLQMPPTLLANGPPVTKPLFSNTSTTNHFNKNIYTQPVNQVKQPLSANQQFNQSTPSHNNISNNNNNAFNHYNSNLISNNNNINLNNNNLQQLPNQITKQQMPPPAISSSQLPPISLQPPLQQQPPQQQPPQQQPLQQQPLQQQAPQQQAPSTLPQSQPIFSQSQTFNSQFPVPTPAPPPGINTQSTVGKRPMYPPQQTPYNQNPVQTQPQPQAQYNNGTNQCYQPQQQQTLSSMPPNQQQPQQPQYNQQHQQQQQQQQQQYPGGYSQVVNQGFNKMWGQNTIDLMQQRHILPPIPVAPPKIHLDHEFYESVNCSPDILRCTLTKIPESNALLQKSRLPLGILIHPFRDLNNLPVIQCSTIVRCRSCRTYINPFVYFVDSKKWKCNLCYRINELPEEFQYDPVSKSYGDVTRRPEVKSSTIEFIAPSEYMLRPPQPAIYLFLLDVSLIAQQTGYLQTVCESLIEHLDAMPGDARTQIGFVTFNSAVHFYSIADGFNQPHEITVVDIDDPFLPCPDNLLINLKECRELLKDLLTLLPNRFKNTHDNSSALGAALQCAFKLMQSTGGRVTVFQTCLPNIGPGALQSRENPNERSSKDVQHLGPATDFYKRQALECSGQQISVDLFLLNSQYSDLATLSGISKFSGGCIHHFPLFNINKVQQVDTFKRCFERYLTRKIGFESVMRVRCTRGLSIHTFHGNFFVRSTDLLSLPNVNPDAGFGMQISYDESLGESKTVCFQAALLYTSSKGERRIRVHTLCLPVTTSLTDVIYSADAQAIIGLISKMAVDRSLQSSISDARDAFINASCDVFSAFRLAQNISQIGGQLIAPNNLTLLPMYMLALLKHIAFRTGTSTRLDDRVFAMCELKTLPLDQLIRYIYPDLYHIDCLFENQVDQNGEKPDPPILQLSAEYLKTRSMFLLDCGTSILILVGAQVPPTILQNVFGVASINEIPDLCCELSSTGTSESENLHAFIDAINIDKPYAPTIQIIRENSPYRTMFTEKLVDDRSESSLSYYEFLQHLRSQVK